MTTEAPGVPQYRGGLRVSSQQADIVDHVLENRLTVVDAGAGSGKTHTAVAAVLEVLDQVTDTSVDRFVLITFTNDAAGELRHRIEKAITARLNASATPEERQRWAETLERLPNAYIGTIHGFCRQFLKAFGYGALIARESEVEFARGLLSQAVMDAVEAAFEEDAAAPITQGLGQDWHNHDLSQLTRDIYEHVRNRGLSARAIADLTAAQPEDVGKPVRVALARLVADVDARYTAEKLREGKVDAADLLLSTAEVLTKESEPGILDKLAARYHYLFIDEFQDTDQVQVRIVDSLRPVLRGVLLVGDEKQSIYGFRGAISQLTEFAEERGEEALELSISRRPTTDLLDVQNALFTRIGERYLKLRKILEPPEDPLAATTELPPMTYVGVGGDADMGLRIAATAAKIRALLQERIDVRGGEPRYVEPGDIAVLFRANGRLDEYERGLTELLGPDILVRKESGGQFFRRPEIIGAYRVLRLLVDYPNDVVLAQALRTPYLRVDASAMEREIMRYGRPRGRDNYITTWFEDNHGELAKRLRGLREAVRIDTLPELLEGTYREFGLRDYHLERGEQRAVGNLERLQELARGLTLSEQALTLRSFVNWLQIRLLAGFDEPDAAEDAEGGTRSDYVRLMTVHKAKGLQFPVVIIPEVQARVNGFVSNIAFVVDVAHGLDVRLPVGPVSSTRFNSLTTRDARVERYEAMRIFYVAVTRAENSVVFVGSAISSQPRQSEDPQYSWKDEICRARGDLEARGARFE